MLVLAFDPGITTGFAVVDGTGTVKMSGSFLLDGLAFWSNFLVSNYDFTDIVMETPPYKIRSHEKAWHLVQARVEKDFKMRVHAISPGLWKPVKVALGKPGDSFSNDHEKDAVHLARFRIRQLNVQKRVEI